MRSIMTASLLLALLCLCAGCDQGSSSNEQYVTVQEYNQYVETTNKNFAAHEGRLVTLEKYYKEEPATPPAPMVRFGSPPPGYIAPAIASAPTPAAAQSATVATSPPTPPVQTVVTAPVTPPAVTAPPSQTTAAAAPTTQSEPLQILRDAYKERLDEVDGRTRKNTEDIVKINNRLDTFATKEELKALEQRVKALEPQPKPEAPPAKPPAEKPAATRTETKTVGLVTYRFTRH